MPRLKVYKSNAERQAAYRQRHQPMAPVLPYWQSADGRYTVYHTDCRAVLPTLTGYDVLITDPPYGVNLGTHGAAHEKRPEYLQRSGYASYDDTPQNFERIIIPAITYALKVAGRGLVFCAGTHIQLMPPYETLGGVFLPAGCGRSKWGFQSFAHFLLYGRCPDLQKGAKPIGFASTERAEVSDHPCPKPLGWMVWCVHLASRPGETVLDCFMGSGTTGVACVKTGRSFIGIEIDEASCAEAVERMERELRQPFLPFHEPLQLEIS